MFLKRLELQGFKSFADKTVLNFMGGVTSVVGPNGSGKSNISDAIRWVMGEMSAKSLRGANMQDVIFAGTETRKPVNYAEVSLVLDNTEHVFPIDFDEVIVTRRVFRSGETAYQINRANCRLKDIHELFMDTGLGRDGYSIIGQGNVSQILSTKAEDRRSLFEEAAGVSKYKYKKEEASRKLAATEENLVRINDITTELESQLTPLKNQSEKARKYLVLYEEFKALDVNLSMINLEKNKLQTEEAEKAYDLVSGELDEIRSREAEVEEKISSLYAQSKQKDEEQREQNARLIENQSKIMECTNEISLGENNIKNNQAIHQRVENEINLIHQKSQEHAARIQALEQEIREKEQQLSDSSQNFSGIREEDQMLAEKQAVLSQEAEGLRGDVIDTLNKISSEKARMQGIENLRESFLERRQTLEEEINSFHAGLETTRQEIENSKILVEEKSKKLEKINGLIATGQEKRQALTAELNTIREQGNTKRVELNSKTSKRRILEDMENEYEGYARSVKTVLKSSELKSLSIYGTVAGLVEANQEYATAIEVALGGALQNIIVETEEDAKEAIAFLRRTKAGRATFLPVSSVKGRMLDNVNAVKKQSGFLGLASELIRYQSKYDGIMKNLLGRVVVVDTIDNGIAMSRAFGYKFRVVTLAGDVLNSGGSMSGGSVNKSGGFLSRSAEIKTLKGEITKLEQEIQKLREDFSKKEEEAKNIDTQLSSYIPVSRAYEDEILRLENTVEHLSATLAASGNTREGYDLELSQIEDQLSSSSDEVAAILNQVRKMENTAAKTREQITVLEEEQQALADKRKEFSDLIMEGTLSLSTLKRDIQDAKNTILSLQEEQEQGKTALEHKQSDQRQIIKNNESIQAGIAEKEALAQELKQLSEEMKKQISAIEEQKSKIVDQLQAIQNSNKELTDRLLQLQQEMSRVETKRVKLNMERENILNRLWDEYELSYSAAEELKTELENEKEAAKRLAELKSQIKGLGSVNMDAIEEYKSVAERYEFLSAQKADLEKAKGNLNQIIQSMEELMEEHFSEQFTIINESFSFVFRELFGGGKGRLYLQDPDNLLESGIEIEVQLPGKGLQNINLYSGGEKSFIAIALLFAILRVKPTPFCILDEIDAALDDVNVSRFATYLKNYLDQTQFIVITHRRGTMEASNVLYGVTMQEKGVSKLLSLQIDEVDAEMAE